MVNKTASRLALAFAVIATPSAASEFGDACKAAEIFTEKNCTCIAGKATAAEMPDIMAALSAEKVQASGGTVDEAATRGMEVLGKLAEQCDKQQ